MVKGYSTDNYTQWAIDYIEGKGRATDKPWYLWLCYGAVHGPFTPADRHLNEYADAEEVANAMQMSYSATAMALMRLVRQDLATRHTDPDTQLQVYEITPKGEARLDYFLEDEFDDE